MVIGGRYRLEESIGEGAMGWVYRGTHLALGSSVAVKIMKPVGGDSTRVARFEHEARAASRIHHPHVLMIHDFGRTAGGLLYIVSELVEGESLGEIQRREGTLPLGRVATIFRQVLAAVEEAHSHHLIHRDLKPENIMVTRLRSGEDFVKVLDFGIARIAESGEARITMQGEICGTPAFMAPERIRGQEATEQSDIYSLCLILYELLTGRPAFEVSSVMEMLALHLHVMPRPLREVAPERDLPEELEIVLERGLRKAPEERIGSIDELRRVLFAALGNLDDHRLPCRGCDLPRPSWSSHCTSCSFAGDHIAPQAIFPEGLCAGEMASQPLFGKAGAATPEALTPEVWSPEGAGSGPWWVGEAEPSAGRTFASAQTVSSSVPAMVGRERELTELEAFLDGPQPVLEVLGPSGIGKTKLLRAVGTRARARGMTVLSAGADPSLGRSPFFAVRALVASRLGLEGESPGPDDLRRAAMGSGLSPEDIPGLSDLFGVARGVERVPASIRLRECYSAAMRAILDPRGDDSGVLILVDDADRLDGASAALLRRLAEAQVGEHSRMIVAAEVSILAVDGPHLSLFLAPLEEASVRDLVESFPAGRSLPRASVGALVEISRGSPLVATQAILLLAEGGVLPSSPGRPGRDLAPSGPDDVLEGIVDARLRRLDGRCRRVLETLSLLGNGARQDLLSLALEGPSGRDRSSLEAALDDLVLRGLLERLPQGMATNGSSFGQAVFVAHPRIASLVLERVPADRRLKGHRRIYGLLKGTDAPVHVLAPHAAQARLGQETLDVLEETGDRVREWLDDEGSVLYYRGALHVARWELLLGEEDERRAGLSLKLGEALTGAGHFLAAEVTFKEALAFAGQGPLLRSRLLLSYARLLIARGIHGEAAALLREALILGLEAGSGNLILELYLDYAEVHVTGGQPTKAIAELEEGILVLTAGLGSESTDVPPGFWRLLLRLAELRAAAGGNRSPGPTATLQAVPVDLATQALGHARRTGDLEGEATCLLALVRYSMPDVEASGRAPNLDVHLAEAMVALRKLGDRRGVAQCLLLQARARPDQDVRTPLAKQALVLASQVRWPEGVAQARLLLEQAA